MYTLTRLFICFALLFFSSSFYLKDNDTFIEQGNVIYSFASGKMQCQSEIDPDGNIVILLKELHKNTTVTLAKVNYSKDHLILECAMSVSQETDLCASWTNIQAVTIDVLPKPVQKITLQGTSIYHSDKVTVLN